MFTVYVENAKILVRESNGVNLVTLKDLRMTLKIGQVGIKLLMYLYKICDLTLYIIQNVLNGYRLKIFKMLPTLPEVVLVRFIQLIDPKDIFTTGILRIKNG